jgi:hypothetical protein
MPRTQWSATETLSMDDIIVEKMHVHYGLKDKVCAIYGS